MSEKSQESCGTKRRNAPGTPCPIETKRPRTPTTSFDATLVECEEGLVAANATPTTPDEFLSMHRSIAMSKKLVDAQLSDEILI
jgi:hypothetical protein